MKFAKLGTILGGFYWLFELAWDELNILYSLALLLIGGFTIGVLLDIFYKSHIVSSIKHNDARNTAYDDINTKKQAYMAKLQQRKANSKDKNIL